MDDVFADGTDDPDDGAMWIEPVCEESDEDRRDYHRYTREERAAKMDRMLETKYKDRATWDEVADRHRVARSTIRRWRQSDEWRMAEARWRRIMREEARSDTTMLAQNALGVLQDLMQNARSEFTRYSAASKVLDLVGVGDEIEESRADTSSELMKFMQQMKLKESEKQRLRDAGIDPDNVIDAEVKPGGLLPEGIVEQNRIRMDERLAGQTALERALLDDDAGRQVEREIGDDASGLAGEE